MDWIPVVAPSLIGVTGAVVGWFLKSRSEELRATQERLVAERRKLYIELLEPYIRMFAAKGDDSAPDTIKAMQTIPSFEYRKTAFEFGFFASDGVMRAWNDMLASFFAASQQGRQIDAKALISAYGRVLLEIRRSLGNKDTSLQPKDMLRSMITDIDRYL